MGTSLDLTNFNYPETRISPRKQHGKLLNKMLGKVVTLKLDSNQTFNGKLKSENYGGREMYKVETFFIPLRLDNVSEVDDKNLTIYYLIGGHD